MSAGRAAPPGGPRTSLPPGLAGLALRCAIAVLVVAAIAVAGLRLGWSAPLPVLVLAGLAVATVTWLTREGIERAPRVITPAPSWDPHGQSPDSGDLRVRRLEDAIHGAQPRVSLTTDVLAVRLREAVEARGPVDPGRLSPELRRLLETAGDPSRPSPPVDRPTLRRLLREIAAIDPMTTPHRPGGTP